MGKFKGAKCPVCGQVIYDPLLSELKAGSSRIDDFAHFITNEALDGLNMEIDVELFDEIKARVSLALMPEEDVDACGE
ncbi:hypothetical protein KAW65_00155 [candidate division WOR-3 bacterium]|nr:hypothetical protein [candidate division WOR-3 bacterium]